jgi:hypothetical protein
LTGNTTARNRDHPALRQRHPLTTFALAANGDLYVNIGSSSDNCETASPAEQASGRCPESEQDQAGVVWRYHIDKDGKVSDQGRICTRPAQQHGAGRTPTQRHRTAGRKQSRCHPAETASAQ